MTARVWEGYTEPSGIPVTFIVPRLACPADADTSQFYKELKETVPPRHLLNAWSSPMVL